MTGHRLTRADALPVEPFTTAQARAYVTLTDAIGDQLADGVLTPCRTDPTTWDADGLAGLEDVQLPARLCRTACPVLAACAAFLATGPEVHGVIAGRYLPRPKAWRGRAQLEARKAVWAASCCDEANVLDGAA